MVHIKDSLLLIRKCRPCGDSMFPLAPAERSSTNVRNKAFSSFIDIIFIIIIIIVVVIVVVVVVVVVVAAAAAAAAVVIIIIIITIIINIVVVVVVFIVVVCVRRLCILGTLGVVGCQIDLTLWIHEVAGKGFFSLNKTFSSFLPLFRRNRDC